ncbi:MAG: TonB-dependent receptor [Desulfobacterales bacterium]|nr:TonB-dependent receptor [Desulfobacterales bacterium]
MMKKLLYSLIALLIFSSVYASDVEKADCEVSGAIYEKGTKKPIKNAVFFVKEASLQIETDDKGEFKFNAKPGEYTIIIPIIGYEKFETQIKIIENEKLVLTFRIEPKIINPYEIVVRSKKPQSEVSAQRISIQEAYTIPGSNRDVIKAISNMPGINSISVFNGYGSGLVIRGSSPEDSVYHVNDQWIPMLYHFGGFESVFEPELIESLEYYAGGFSPEFYEAMGGVVKVNFRDPRTDRIGGYVNLSLLSSSIMLEGPINDSDSFAISVKRGFLDVYTRMLASEFEDELSFTTYPVYYDTNFLYTKKLSNLNKLRLIGVCSSDSMEMVLEDEAESPRFSNKLSTDLSFANFIFEWEYKKGDLKSIFSPMLSYEKTSFDFGPRAYFIFRQDILSLSEKLEFSAGEKHLIKTGGRFVTGIVKIESSFFAPPKEGEVTHNPYEEEINDDQKIHFYFPAFYLMDQMAYGDFIVTPGVAALYDTHNEHFYVDPRFSIKYMIRKDLALKYGMGLFSKMPEEDESHEPWGTEGLKPERSYHYIGGFEKNITDDISLDVQGYYKDFKNLVSRTDDEDPTEYENAGTGYAYGAELLLRHKLTDKFFGWMSYSYCVSKRKDGPNEKERFFDMDIPHNLTFVLSYKFNKEWQVGARFNYSSGLPYTDLLSTDTIYDVDNDYYLPIYNGDVNNKRLKARHQLDIRIDRYWLFDKFVLSTYLDIQNVYMNDPVFRVTYSDDYTEKEDLKGLPVMIFLGLKADF